MAIYVDQAKWEWKGKLWAHLLADSLDELHGFADQLGLQRSWFQGSARFPHYDITARVRDKALLLGAKDADRRTIAAAALKLQQEHRRQTLPAQGALLFEEVHS